jgi:1L-myo-inositol 1-phosphate cytidylyltransferase
MDTAAGPRPVDGTAPGAAAPRHAVILAAGLGSRLRDLSQSKPLTPVCGFPLLELGVRQAAAAGIDHIVVVTGHEADRVEAALPDLAARCGVTIQSVRVADWTLPNGHSVIAGAALVDGPFLLMMADHIFSAEILQRLAREGAAARDVTLAIDRRLDNPLVDPDDATWVRTRPDGTIAAIGKTIAPYDAVDCGAFLATAALPAAIAQAVALGRAGSLSDGMQVLADAGRAATMEIDGAWWIDVDDPRAHAQAEADLPGAIPALFTPAI